MLKLVYFDYITYLSLFSCSGTHCHSFIGLLPCFTSLRLGHARVLDVGAREGGQVFGGQNSLPAHPYNK